MHINFILIIFTPDLVKIRDIIVQSRKIRDIIYNLTCRWNVFGQDTTSISMYLIYWNQPSKYAANKSSFSIVLIFKIITLISWGINMTN